MLEPTQEVFERVLLWPVEPDRPGPALLSWRVGDLDGRAVQVYVNDRLYDVVFDEQQRELWLHLERRGETWVELLAVDVREAWADRSERLAGWSPRFVGGADLTMVRDEAWPVESRVVVSVDGEDHSPQRLWRAWESRGGFGGLFGRGGFGYDLATGSGIGLGEFGLGAFGADGNAWRWEGGELSEGTHEVGIGVEDPTGEIVAELAEAEVVTIDPPPRPAEAVNIGPGFELTW